jgi:membrane fusion protein, multidrug efflux system
MKGGGRVYLAGALLVVAAMAGVGFLAASRRAQARSEAETRTAAVEAGPHVFVVTVNPSDGGRSVLVQGEARPYASVTLYAKVSGYLREIQVDRGDRVSANQVLAVIESPELDRQYDGAIADARNKRAIAKRSQTLAEQGVISAQDADTDVAAADVADATVASLASQKEYEVIRAPFAGTVTARYVDRGALVQNAASAQTSALPVVTVSQTDRLRVTGYLDQADAPFVKVGDAAEIKVPGQAGLLLQGTVSRVSRELDARTRKMLAEVDLENRDGRVVTGSFLEVSLKIRGARYLKVPVEALVFRGTTPFVAIISKDDRVTYRSVKVGDDDGRTAVVLDGLAEGERIAVNLGDTVTDGSRVQPAEGARH